MLDIVRLRPPRYQLNTDSVLTTVRKLKERIKDRFPDSGLLAQAKELERIGERARERIAWISKPNWLLRFFAFSIIALLVGAVVLIVVAARPGFDASWDLERVIELMEAAINDLVLIGLAIFFLLSIEVRVKRRRALNALHELRSMAHVIDMHQLTKDPDRLLGNRHDTSHSPKNTLTAFELRRYLDYCSEMLSLCSKIASSYVQNFEDAAAVAAVNEIETLTTGLSRKIWQKIMILQPLEETIKDKALPVEEEDVPEA